MTAVMQRKRWGNAAVVTWAFLAAAIETVVFLVADTDPPWWVWIVVYAPCALVAAATVEIVQRIRTIIHTMRGE